MTIVEPCCSQKQLRYFFNTAFRYGKRAGTIMTSGDFIMADFIKWMAVRLPGSEITIACEKIEEDTLKAVTTMMDMNYYDSVSKRFIHFIRKATFIPGAGLANGELLKPYMSHLKERLTVCADLHSLNIITMKTDDKCYVMNGMFPQRKLAVPVTSVIHISNDFNDYEDIHTLLDSKARTKNVILTEEGAIEYTGKKSAQ